MARQCRAKIGGAADPATSYSRRATMHGAAQAFRRAMAIGAAKSVSFEKKLNSVRFKISLKNVKNKKILLSGEDQTASDVSCEKNKKSEPD